MDRGIWRVGELPLVPAPERALGRLWRPLLHAGLLVSDAALIYLGFAIAYWMRYVLQIGRSVPFESFRQLSDFRPLALALTLLLPLIFQLKGLYRLPRRRSWFDQLGIISSGTTIGLALAIIGSAFLPTLFFFFFYSRLIFVYAWISIILALGLGRLLTRLVVRWAWAHGMGQRRVLLIGATGLAQQVMQALADESARGTLLLGYLDDPDEQLVTQRGTSDRFACLGPIDELETTVRNLRVDQVIIALPFWAHHRLPQLVNACRTLGVEFALAPDLYEVSFNRVDIDQLSGLPLISLNKTVIRGWNLLLKRLLDAAMIVATAPLWGPLWGLCALLIKLESPGGSVLFRQRRVGKGGAHFSVYKFRTMVPNAEQLKAELLDQNEADGPIFKMRRDPRVTRVGRWLRKTSLDELPQFINIMRGEMSLVGPRPAVPEEVAQYSAWHMRRLEVVPGLTGLWQVRGRSDTTFDEMVRLDIYYSEHWSLGLDLRIMLQTIPAVLAGRGAY